MTISSKPAKLVALMSLFVAVVSFGVTILLGRWSGFFAVFEMSWLILSAGFVWLVLSVLFHQRSLAEQEKLDLSQLSKAEQGPTIFQADGERATLFAIAQRRLEILEKWFLPAFAVVLAVYQICIGLYLLRAVSGYVVAEGKQPLVCAISMTAIAFVSFLICRYATGMSNQQQWRPLRAGGSIFLGIAFLCFALAIGLALAQFKIFIVVTVVNYIIPILLIVLGGETALNIVLDIYRPRLKGQYSRSAFDSRLLGVINEPTRIFRTVASTIDYQFGFEVSQTWFYKLLEKAIVPLVLFAIATLYLSSCIVVISANEEAIIEHFGSPLSKGNDVRIIGPGLAFKRPWPIDIVYRYPTSRVTELAIGFVPEIDPKTGEAEHGPLLWGKSHYHEEFNVLVASRQAQSGFSVDAAVPVNLVTTAVPVHYKIKDLYAFLYNHNEPEKLLESICYGQLTEFAASATIEIDDDIAMEQSLLGAGRTEAKKILTRRIQAAADEAGLGVEIVFLGIQGIHPPTEVAADYQKVIGAIQKKRAIILQAQAQRDRILASLAGSVGEAEKLYRLAAEYQQAKQDNNYSQAQKLEHDLDLSFAAAKGDIFGALRQAKSSAFEKVALAQATGRRFASQLSAYNAAREIYKRQQRLVVLEESLENIRKFVIVADQNDTQVFIVDVQEKLTPSLYELTGLEESTE